MWLSNSPERSPADRQTVSRVRRRVHEQADAGRLLVGDNDQRFVKRMSTNDKVGQFRLPTKSVNKNLSSVMQKSAEFVCH